MSIDDDGEYRTVQVSCVPGLNEVRVYEETLQHVLENHPEISRTFVGAPSFNHAVDVTISDPTFVEKSYANSVVFVNESMTNWDGQPLRVPVKVLSEFQSGYMKTAFFGTTDAPGEFVYKKVRDDE